MADNTAPVIIIGSGASAAAAALELARLGIRPLMLDVGMRPDGKGQRVEGNLYEWRKRNDTFDYYIGEEFRGVHDVLTGDNSIAKLNAPNAAFVTRDAARFSPIETTDFDVIQSFAMGGLGNQWGAGFYRFDDADLAGSPIHATDLAPYFDALTREVGISGADDDLTPYFGDPGGLLPPIQLSHNATAALRTLPGSPGKDQPTGRFHGPAAAGRVDRVA